MYLPVKLDSHPFSCLHFNQAANNFCAKTCFLQFCLFKAILHLLLSNNHRKAFDRNSYTGLNNMGQEGFTLRLSADN